MPVTALKAVDTEGVVMAVEDMGEATVVAAVAAEADNRPATLVGAMVICRATAPKAKSATTV